MRGTKAKELRKNLGFDYKSHNEIQKRIYRRLKKEYSFTPRNKRESFMAKLKALMEAKS